MLYSGAVLEGSNKVSGNFKDSYEQLWIQHLLVQVMVNETIDVHWYVHSDRLVIRPFCLLKLIVGLEVFDYVNQSENIVLMQVFLLQLLTKQAD